MPKLTRKQRVVFMRFLRSTAATAIGGAIGWLLSPDAVDLVPTEYAALVSAVLIPTLLMVEKWLRYGTDEGEIDPHPEDPNYNNNN